MKGHVKRELNYSWSLSRCGSKHQSIILFSPVKVWKVSKCLYLNYRYMQNRYHEYYYIINTDKAKKQLEKILFIILNNKTCLY